MFNKAQQPRTKWAFIATRHFYNHRTVVTIFNDRLVTKLTQNTWHESSIDEHMSHSGLCTFTQHFCIGCYCSLNIETLRALKSYIDNFDLAFNTVDAKTTNCIAHLVGANDIPIPATPQYSVRVQASGFAAIAKTNFLRILCGFSYYWQCNAVHR